MEACQEKKIRLPFYFSVKILVLHVFLYLSSEN